MANMLQKMNIKGFAESTIRSLKVRTFYDLMHLTYDKVAIEIGPVNASNLIEAIYRIKNGNISDYIIVGALGFSGVAATTWKTIFETISLKSLVEKLERDPDSVALYLSKIHGIGIRTANIIVSEYQYFRQDLLYIIQTCNYRDTQNDIVSMGNLKQIRFSGCRNLQLTEQLSNLGYDISGDAGVTKKTDILLIPYAGYSSNKVSKVGEQCQIVPIDEFKSDMQKYL